MDAVIAAQVVALGWGFSRAAQGINEIAKD